MLFHSLRENIRYVFQLQFEHHISYVRVRVDARIDDVGRQALGPPSCACAKTLQIEVMERRAHEYHRHFNSKSLDGPPVFSALTPERKTPALLLPLCLSKSLRSIVCFGIRIDLLTCYHPIAVSLGM